MYVYNRCKIRTFTCCKGLQSLQPPCPVSWSLYPCIPALYPDRWAYAKSVDCCTQRNLFQILVNQPEIGLYLPFSDWFGTQTDIVRLLFQINRKMVNTIWFRFDLLKLLWVCTLGVELPGKDSVC